MKTKKILPPVKTGQTSKYLTELVHSRFPQNYREMVYVEPVFRGGSVFLNKEPSVEEVINDKDVNWMSIWKSLRDDPHEFISRLKRMKQTEDTFKRAKNRKPEDELERSINEFVIRKMSRNGEGKTFLPADNGDWKADINDLFHVHERLEKVFIFNKPPHAILQTFNDSNTLVYFEASDDESISTDEHIAIANILNNFNGKCIVRSKSCPLYNRLYKTWKSNRYKKNTGRIERIWVNYT